MSDFRKIGPAVVDADRVRAVFPSATKQREITITYHDGKADYIHIDSSANPEITDDVLIERAIGEFYRPYNPPGVVTYEPKVEDK